ncbi:hypothetical protein RIF29_28651 [Crotalaria pallida]|uniref:Uncharacterized protein n=1 Tax=Crotalaria pallida TaxID=3830 RepID=A0AAN9EF77_CROPI
MTYIIFPLSISKLDQKKQIPTRRSYVVEGLKAERIIHSQISIAIAPFSDLSLTLSHSPLKVSIFILLSIVTPFISFVVSILS